MAAPRLRPTSDVNVIAVLNSVPEDQMTALSPVVAMLHAALQLKVMFLRKAEITDAVLAFPVKFADIRRRRRVLFGDDAFAEISISRNALVGRLRQVLLNLILRTRESYAERVSHEEQLIALVADMAGPLRSAAAALLDLENTPASSAKHALERIAASFHDPKLVRAVSELSVAREKEALAPGDAPAAIFSLLNIAERMLERLSQLEP